MFSSFCSVISSRPGLGAVRRLERSNLAEWRGVAPAAPYRRMPAPASSIERQPQPLERLHARSNPAFAHLLLQSVQNKRRTFLRMFRQVSVADDLSGLGSSTICPLLASDFG